ncbi:hypothetical protein DFA_08699 [Cavenderia fasciculata]|uniref:Leucine-rich repeat-containing protein n=1 Tax=Cavenderia fasciculata TaxID=261658 RepID=F4Q3U7_CACFS|nr:uncharacterized protein DFA_08699 [Cavenderia fasciculata]EGG17703.1 hypothetical protein DFA_08699 [Cavenderia fasciculata]|eukprot:XP_004356187.1 hypothetical protein DFA_08699 [Cavenderia fasciculata]
MDTTNKTTTILTTTKQDDDCSVQLPKYIQSVIIEKLIQGYDAKDRQHYNGFQCIPLQQATHLMFNKTPKKKHNFITLNQLSTSIGLVSKWWLKVTRQTALSLKINGPLQESYFSNVIVESLKWKVNGAEEAKINFDFKRLPLLLPHLKSLDIVAMDAANEDRIRDIIRVINSFPRIQVNLNFELADYFDLGYNTKWPTNVHFQGLDPKVVLSHSNNVDYFDCRGTSEYCHQMLDDLIPTYVNIAYDDGQNDGGVVHFWHSDMFEHLQQTQHINIEYDFVTMVALKDLLTESSKTQTLKVGLITCPLEYEMSKDDDDNREPFDCEKCEDHGTRDLDNYDTFEDLETLCSALTNNSTLKRLWLENPHGKDKYEREEEEEAEDDENDEDDDDKDEKKSISIKSISSLFASIWKTNSSVEFLALSNHPKIISPSFFSTLCPNKIITTLMLIDGTLNKEYIPSFCQLLKTNKTIKALNISGNLLKPCKELNQAFKQNKSIQVLNIAGNRFSSDLFNALLESDTIQYLIIDKTMAEFYSIHRYFKQSKSLIKCFVLEDPYQDELFNHDDPLFIYFKPSLLG